MRSPDTIEGKGNQRKRGLAAAAAGALVLAASSPVHAEPPARSYASLVATPTLLAAPTMCAPGTQTACSCPGGGRGTQTCEPSGVRFSLCACASVSVSVPGLPPIPQVRPVDVDWRRPSRPHRPSRRTSGLGMLIGGGVSLLVGTGNLIWGIERLRDTRNDPLGIVMIATGGVAMAAGLPLTIVGTVLLATRGLHPGPASLPFQIAPTENGPAIVF